MATTKPIIFTQIEITDVGGGNSTTFDKHLVDSVEVTLEPVTSTVEDGQTLTDAYDVSFSVNVYDTTLLNDARVYTDASADTTKGTITFSGATGASDITLTSVIINGSRVFDQNRVAARITGSKRAVSISNSVTVADA